jgi:hypothetical protein
MARVDFFVPQFPPREAKFAVLASPTRTLIGAAASRAMDIFIDQIEEATGLGAVMDLLQDLLGGATDPAFLSVVAVAGAFLDTAAAPLST